MKTIHKIKKTAVTTLIKVQPKGQVTLPSKLRLQAGISVGDYVAVIQTREGITLTPQDVVPRHPETDAAIAEGLEDIRAGRVSPAFKNMKKFGAWLKTDAGKRFSA